LLIERLMARTSLSGVIPSPQTSNSILALVK